MYVCMYVSWESLLNLHTDGHTGLLLPKRDQMYQVVCLQRNDIELTRTAQKTYTFYLPYFFSVFRRRHLHAVGPFYLVFVSVQ